MENKAAPRLDETDKDNSVYIIGAGMGMKWKRLAPMYQEGTTTFDTDFILFFISIFSFLCACTHRHEIIINSSHLSLCVTNWLTDKSPDIDRLTDGWTQTATDGCIVWRQALGDIDRCICSLRFPTVNFIVYTVNQLTGQVLLLKTVLVSLTAHCQVDVVDDLRSLCYLDPHVSAHS